MYQAGGGTTLLLKGGLARPACRARSAGRVTLEAIVSSGPSQPGSPSDDELLAQLRDIAAEADPVPALLLDAARSAFELRDLDAILAELVHDSALDAPAMAVRGGGAERILSFVVQALAVECQITARGSRRDLLGQLVGGRAEEMDVQVTGAVTSVPVNDAGRFGARNLPAGPFRLHCRLADGTGLVTSWAAL
jgi:hypothetical protein